MSVKASHWMLHNIQGPMLMCVRGAGSYSYVAVGASGKTYEALAKPVRRRLLFAGEHTSMEVTAANNSPLRCPVQGQRGVCYTPHSLARWEA
jgi:Flavin containing amine oxidoreductase